MLSHPKLYNTPSNPYLIKYGGGTAVFHTPIWKTLLILITGVLFCAAGIGMIVGFTSFGGFDFVQGLECFAGTCVLWCGICLVMTTGVNKIVFDLSRRTYSRVLPAPSPLPGLRYPDAVGWGNPFFRRVLTGAMSDLKGVQVVEQQDSGQQMYSVYIVSRDESVFPCVVYYSTSLNEAQAQGQEISSLLNLPILKTLLMDGTAPLPASYRRRPWRNPYLARCDQNTLAFKTPLWRLIFGIFFGAFLAVPPAVFMVIQMVRWGGLVVPALLFVNLPLVLVGVAIAVSSGANAIVFDLNTGRYRRLLLGPGVLVVGKSSTGVGNVFQRRIIDGATSEIQGVQIREGYTKNGRAYVVRLIWPEDAYPPYIAYWGNSLEDARAQQYEITMLLKLPILEPERL